jgi:hypothetical protein
MPDTPASIPAAGTSGEPPKKKRSQGPFNAAQLAELSTATELVTAAQESEHKAALGKQGITDAWLTSFATKVGAANAKVTAASGGQEDSEEETAEAADSRETLTKLLRDLQKAAKQKQRMWATDDDPETNFNTDGYLIGKRLHPSNDVFLANARALSAKAKADDLPGIGATEITALDAAIAQHAADLAAQPQGREAATKATAERNAAIETITSHRIALQYAADRAYPPGDPLTAPSRKRFRLDPDKGLGV